MIGKIIIATRESALALWQARFIRDRLAEAAPEATVEILGMTTRGDKWLSSPLSEVGGKGLFIKELEEAMLDGRADVAVHSMKDVPAVLPEGFQLPLIGFRADVRDALVSRGGERLDELPEGARIGSSSLRRQAMLLALRPDLEVLPVRGNVGTRLERLDEGNYDALILAAAGLERLGLETRISELLPVEKSLPAAGQGALGAECRADAGELAALLESLDKTDAAVCVRAERAVSAGLGADCSAPLGAHAQMNGDRLDLEARLATPDGRTVLRAEATAAGDALDPEALGGAVAADLVEQGAADLLAGLASGKP